MRDGQTRRTGSLDQDSGAVAFLARFDVKLVVISGRAAGNEFPMRNERATIGRGPGVDLAFDDQAMSRQHAIVDFGAEGLRVRDLGSTNGILFNGKRVQTADLSNGDRLEIGGLEFQLVIEQREDEPQTYELSAEV